MPNRHYRKLGSCAIIIIILLSFFSFLIFPPAISSKMQANGEYTYYGVVPARLYQYNLTDLNDPNSKWRLDTGSVSNTSMVAISAIKDNTEVKVYVLNNSTLVSDVVLQSTEKRLVVLPNATAFKVVTTEFVSVLLLRYDNDSTYIPVPNTFYQSTSGAYVGTEFVFMASQRVDIAYVILALENAEVTITGEDGDMKAYSLEANTYKELVLRGLTTYRVESTGNIMIQSGRPPDIYGVYYGFFVPAVEGGFVGQTFYTWSTTSWDPRESYGFRVSAAQDTTVTVWNLQTKELLMTADVARGGGFGFKPLAPVAVVKSTAPVTLMYVHNGSIESSLPANSTYGAYGSGVAYIGVRPNEDTPIYLPMQSYVEAYIFASEETQITIDGSPYTLSADSFYLYAQLGTHIIRSDKKVVIEVLSWPSTPPIQGLQYEGVQIPCIQTVNVVPNVILTPLGEAFPITYIAIGAATATIAVVAVFLLRKRHS
jgi:hypothetical protein